MTRTHKAVRAKAQRLTIRQVQATLQQEAQAWALLRGLRWGYGRVPLCPRCSRPTWADDSRDARKRWECQACPSNPWNRTTTKFSDAVGTPFDCTRASLALALLLFAYGSVAWAVIKAARVPAAQIPTKAILDGHRWKEKHLVRRLRGVALRLRLEHFDLSRMVRKMEAQAAQADQEKAREVKKRYDQKINKLKGEITDLTKKMQEEIRRLHRYRPISSALIAPIK